MLKNMTVVLRKLTSVMMNGDVLNSINPSIILMNSMSAVVNVVCGKLVFVLLDV